MNKEIKDCRTCHYASEQGTPYGSGNYTLYRCNLPKLHLICLTEELVWKEKLENYKHECPGWKEKSV